MALSRAAERLTTSSPPTPGGTAPKVTPVSSSSESKSETLADRIARDAATGGGAGAQVGIQSDLANNNLASLFLASQSKQQIIGLIGGLAKSLFPILTSLPSLFAGSGDSEGEGGKSRKPGSGGPPGAGGTCKNGLCQKQPPAGWGTQPGVTPPPKTVEARESTKPNV